MAQVDTDICNLALSHVGSTTVLQSLSEVYKEAQQCNLHYEPARQEVLRRIDWGFAKRTVALASQGDPPSTWRFSYAYPSACERVLKVYDPRLYSRDASPLPPFEVSASDNQEFRRIWSDQDEAVAEYIADVTQVSAFDQQFVMALSHLIASRLAVPLMGDHDVAERMLNRYEYYIQQAAMSDRKERREDMWRWRSDWEKARD